MPIKASNVDKNKTYEKQILKRTLFLKTCRLFLYLPNKIWAHYAITFAPRYR